MFIQIQGCLAESSPSTDVHIAWKAGICFSAVLAVVVIGNTVFGWFSAVIFLLVTANVFMERCWSLDAAAFYLAGSRV